MRAQRPRRTGCRARAWLAPRVLGAFGAAAAGSPLGCSRGGATLTPAADTGAQRAHESPRRDAGAAPAAALDASAPVARFDPRWECRVTGPGHFGHRPEVSVPPARPFAERGTIGDVVPARNNRLLVREPVSDGGHAVLSQGALMVVEADGGLRDGAAPIARQTYAVPPEAVEMIFEDARGGGVAWLRPDGSIRVQRMGGAGEETLVEHAGDLTRACRGTVTDALRLIPIASRPWEFPTIRGIPPSVADARWTISRDAAGLCVARLEGEGPWGRVFVVAGPNGMRGELSLADGLNPVECGVAPLPPLPGAAGSSSGSGPRNGVRPGASAPGTSAPSAPAAPTGAPAVPTSAATMAPR